MSAQAIRVEGDVARRGASTNERDRRIVRSLPADDIHAVEDECLLVSDEIGDQAPTGHFRGTGADKVVVGSAVEVAHGCA